MSFNFVESLEKTAADIKRPPILPVGTYDWQIKKYDFDRSADGRWEMCVFHLNCLGPGDDVDPDELADFGSAPGTYMRFTFMFDSEDRARFMQKENALKRFLSDHVQCWDGEGKLKEGLANSIGARFSGVVRHRSDKTDPEVQYAEIAKTAPVA
jgi:hypothetical protein